MNLEVIATLPDDIRRATEEMIRRQERIEQTLDAIMHIVKREAAAKEKAPKHDDLLTTAQVAELLGVSRYTVRDQCKAHRIPYYKQGNGRLYFKRSELMELITEKRIPTDEELARTVK